jgi:magnesium-transporting ATPase (P-type)
MKIFQRILHPQNLKRVINYCAYSSLILDITIAIITTFYLFNPGEPEKLLLPVNVMLTIIVIFSIISAALILFMNFYQKVLWKTYPLRYLINKHIRKLRKPKYKFNR